MPANVTVRRGYQPRYGSFEVWMKHVEHSLKAFDTTSYMLPDYDYRRDYENGVKPWRAARNAINAAKDF